MAYSLNGSTQSISGASAPATAAPLTLALWSNVTSLTVDGMFLSLGAGAGTHFFGLWSEGTTAGDPISAALNGGSSAGSFSGSQTANTWQHVCGVYTSATARTGYYNGVAGTANTANQTPSGISVMGIGVRRRSTDDFRLPGSVGEVAIWNAALEAEEVAALAKGFKPQRIRPQSLVFYAPLIRNLIDIDRGLALTNNNGATVANHPRVY